MCVPVFLEEKKLFFSKRMARDFSTLYSLYLCFKLTFQGILDACRVDIFLLSLRNDITILLSIFLNSVLFFGASYLMQITAPIIVTAIFSSIHDELAYADSFRELAFFISHLIVNCFSYFMFYAWTIPWNISWLGPTAREIYRKKKGDPPASGEEIPSMISMFAFRMVFTMSFSLQTLVLSFIPITGKGLYWFSFCCINSFLFFELTWSIESKRFVKNMERFEENWPYYIGFGVPFTLLCYPFTGAIQLALMGCLMQMVFFFFLIFFFFPNTFFFTLQHFFLSFIKTLRI